MPGACLFVEGHLLLTLPAVGLQGRRGGREARAGGRMPTGTQAERKARRWAPALGDARASNSSSSSKGQWGHSHLRGPPRDILQPPGQRRKSPALLYVMEVLLNWSAGGNMYTHSANIHEHTDPHVQTCNQHTCTPVCMHTHIHTIHAQGYWKTLLSLGRRDVNRVGKQRGRLCPAAHPWFVMLPVDMAERTFPRPKLCRVMPSGGADRLGPVWQTGAKV